MAKKHCRICLKPDNDDLISAQLVQDSKTIADMIFAVAGVSVTNDRRLPQNICLICLERLKAAYQLQQQCIESDTYLRTELLPKTADYLIDKDNDEAVYFSDKADEGQEAKQAFLEIREISEDQFDDATCTQQAATDSEIAIIEHTERMEQCSENDFADQWQEGVHYVAVEAQRFACCGCNSGFDSIKELKVHSIRFHRKSKYRSKLSQLQCTVCYQTFRTCKTMEAHQKNRERKTFPMLQCLLCSELVQERESIIDHLELHRPQWLHASENNRTHDDLDQANMQKMQTKNVVQAVNIEIDPDCQIDASEQSIHGSIDSGDETWDGKYDIEIDFNETSAEAENRIDNNLEVECTTEGIEASSNEDKKMDDYSETKDSAIRLQKVMCRIPPTTLRVIAEEECYSIVERIQERCCCCTQFFKTTQKLEAHLAKTRRIIMQDTEDGSVSTHLKYACEYCGMQFKYSFLFALHKRIREQRQFYMCHLCKKLFGCESRMKSHMLHSEEHANFFKLFREHVIDYYDVLTLPGERCCCCWKYFHSKAEMLEHFRTTHAQDGEERDTQKSTLPYGCKICSRRFDKTQHLEQHRVRATNVLEYHCKLCQFQTRSQRRIEFHLCSTIHRSKLVSFELKPLVALTKPERQWYCCFDNCTLQFHDLHILYQHVREVHSIQLEANKEQSQGIMETTDGDVLECDTCGLLFKSVKELHTHQSPPVIKQLMCSICGAKKRSRAILLVHERTHTGERPYGCKECEKRFSSKSLLSSHQKCHGPREYQCQVCNEMFARLENLKRHIRLRHSEATHQCHLCPKMFKTRETLGAHIRSHTGEKPYKCRTCDKHYINIADRRRHEMSVHTLERPHKCSQCDMAFIRRRQLIIHERRHKGDKPFVCTLCKKGFYERSHLNKHSCVAIVQN